MNDCSTNNGDESVSLRPTRDSDKHKVLTVSGERFNNAASWTPVVSAA